MAIKSPEVWLRGPLTDVPPLLQPVAHALFQAVEEVEDLMLDFPEEKLWLKPFGVASPGFHLLHLKGVMDRLFTYARKEMLNQHQMDYLSGEVQIHENLKVSDLINALKEQVALALAQLKSTDITILTEFRGVGRKQLPTTVLGLYTHVAEHSMRHVGQLLVTVKALKAE